MNIEQNIGMFLTVIIKLLQLLKLLEYFEYDLQVLWITFFFFFLYSASTHILSLFGIEHFWVNFDEMVSDFTGD